MTSKIIAAAVFLAGVPLVQPVFDAVVNDTIQVSPGFTGLVSTQLTASQGEDLEGFEVFFVDDLNNTTQVNGVGFRPGFGTFSVVVSFERFGTLSFDENYVTNLNLDLLDRAGTVVASDSKPGVTIPSGSGGAQSFGFSTPVAFSGFKLMFGPSLTDVGRVGFADPVLNVNLSSIAAVPVPAALSLLLTSLAGLTGLGLIRRRRTA